LPHQESCQECYSTLDSEPSSDGTKDWEMVRFFFAFVRYSGMKKREMFPFSLDCFFARIRRITQKLICWKGDGIEFQDSDMAFLCASWWGSSLLMGLARV